MSELDECDMDKVLDGMQGEYVRKERLDALTAEVERLTQLNDGWWIERQSLLSEMGRLTKERSELLCKFTDCERRALAAERDCRTFVNDNNALREALRQAELQTKRYERLRILGCAPYGSKQLEAGTVIRATGLDEFIDQDIQVNPSRGEALQTRAGGGHDIT